MKIQGAGGEEWQTFEFKKGGQTDPDAWRELAEGTAEQIDALRCRDAEWRIVDARGEPICNTEVDIEQVESSFTWGFNSWGWMGRMAAGEWDHAPARNDRALYEDFLNCILLLHYWAETTPDNAPVNEEYQGEVDYDVLDRMVNWALGNGIRCKGHPLFWQVPKALPSWLAKYDLDTRWKFVEVRIRQICSRFRGRISSYDVSNEMLWEPRLENTAHRHWPHIEPIGPLADDHARLIGWARSEDPDACLILNEYGLLAGDREPLPSKSQLGEEVSRHGQMERFLQLTAALKERGQSPDALGLQTTPGEWGATAAFLQTINALGSSGLPVHITELRPNVKPVAEQYSDPAEREQAVAEYVSTIYKACFANPHCEALYLWSLSILKQENRKGGNHRLKPSATYKELKRLIRDEWMTRTTALTDNNGYLRFRGYTGTYRLAVQGSTPRVRVELPAKPTNRHRAEVAAC